MDLFNRKALAVMKAAMESWRSQAETAWKTIATQNEAYDRRLATATLKLEIETQTRLNNLFVELATKKWLK